jgi:drug/metabolite transporter (DMT)-like permease
VTSVQPLDARGTAITLLLSALWGANPVAVKVGLAYVPPLRLACMRLALGGLAILIYAWLTRRRGVFAVRPGEWKVLWSVGLLFAVQAALMNMGLERTTAAHASLLINSYAVHTVVLAHFFIPGDRLSASKLGGILVAYAGIVTLFVPDFSLTSATLLGDLLVAASALLLGERTVYLARAVQTLDPIKLLIYQSIIGGGLLLLWSAWWEAGVPNRYTMALLVSLLYQGAVVAGFNFVMNMYLMQRYRPSALAAWSLTTPIFGVLVSFVIGGDTLTLTLLLSTLLVAAGVGLTTRR